ncbi:MAG: hypothetical protein KDD50_10495 [Bdellovibrionales bacterium]|nr:hypothetical protein [Bdellovibrionales bacterium]
MKNRGLLFLIVMTFLGCGIKGKPLPPERPVDLGRGKPTYKGATQKLLLESIEQDSDEDTKKKKDKGNKND